MAHNKTLTELKWFKWALWGPIATAAIFAVIIAIYDNCHQTLSWGLSSAHINDAISRLKFPLAIASLAFPLVALVASHHRSVQTAAQIARTDEQIKRFDQQKKSTDEKNAFENRLKHFEFFKEYLTEKINNTDLGIKNYHLLYERIFRKNDFDFFSPVVIKETKEYSALSNRENKRYEHIFEFYQDYLVKFCTCFELNDSHDAYMTLYDLTSYLSINSFKGLRIDTRDNFSLVFKDLYGLCRLYESLAELYGDMIFICVKSGDRELHHTIPFTYNIFRVNDEVVFDVQRDLTGDFEEDKKGLRALYDQLSSDFETHIESLRETLKIHTEAE